MSQEKLAQVKFSVEGLYTPGHARRCEAMIRNAGGGIESVKADDMNGTVTILYDTRQQSLRTIKDIVDDTGYLIVE